MEKKKNNTLVLTNDKEIRVMTDPYRLKIYHIFINAKPHALTVKDVADRMGEPHGKVYYHIKKMLDIDALELVREEKINGITAKYYTLAFDSIDFKYDEMDSVKRNDILNNHIASMLSQTMDEWKTSAMNALLATEDNIAKFRALGHHEEQLPDNFDQTFSSGNLVFKNQEEYRSFRKEILNLLDRYEPKESQDYPFQKEFHFSLFTNTQQMSAFLKHIEKEDSSS